MTTIRMTLKMSWQLSALAELPPGGSRWILFCSAHFKLAMFSFSFICTCFLQFTVIHYKASNALFSYHFTFFFIPSICFIKIYAFSIISRSDYLYKKIKEIPWQYHVVFNEQICYFSIKSFSQIPIIYVVSENVDIIRQNEFNCYFIIVHFGISA